MQKQGAVFLLSLRFINSCYMQNMKDQYFGSGMRLKEQYMTTERLYYSSPYLREFTARVLAAEAYKDQYAVQLDQTAFYPEGGGQPSDIGLIDGIAVLEVREREGKILHILPRAIDTGKAVQCSIDWEYRYSLMQHHTGEHIVSGLIHKHHGLDNVGFHMGKDVVTLDFNGELSAQELREIEQMANEAIYSNQPIKVDYPDAHTLSTMPYRSKKALEGDVRIVKAGSYDCCACCGIHVANTSEVGIIKLINATKYKGGIRVSMLCGQKAVAHYDQLLSSVGQISALLSAKPEEIAVAVAQQKEEVVALKQRLAALTQHLCAYKAQEARRIGNHAFYSEEGLSPDELRLIAAALAKATEGVAAAISQTAQGMTAYSLCSERQDVRPLCKALNGALEGRGGGNEKLAAGSVKADAATVEEFFINQFQIREDKHES